MVKRTADSRHDGGIRMKNKLLYKAGDVKFKAGDVVVCTHQYCEHYGHLGIVVSSHWAGVDREYVTVQFDYSENCGSSRAFFGNDHPGSLEVIDSMPDLVGLTPTQIHEVLIKEAPTTDRYHSTGEPMGGITGSPVVTKGTRCWNCGMPQAGPTLTYKGYVFELSMDAWGPMLTMKCGTCGKGDVKRLDTIFPELRGVS